MTIDHSSTLEVPLEILTTFYIGITQETTGSSSESSTSRAGFYFQCAVVVIGFVGTVLNGLILYALIASEQHRKQVLIFNQNLLDFASSFFMFTTHAVKLDDIELGGTGGRWLCLIVLSEVLNFGPLLGSFMNLAAVTVERYVKVVHHVWAKKWLRKWMVHSMMPFTWLGGYAVAWGWTVPTTGVDPYRTCLLYTSPSPRDRQKSRMPSSA